MKNPVFLFLSVLISFAACRPTATLNTNPDAPPPPTEVKEVEQAQAITPVVKDTTVKILILGNSITHHGPLASIGWHGDWGMAASAADKDFVHVLISKLQTYKPDKKLDYREQNIAYWEQDFGYDFSKDPLLQYKPDILIIRLGENVKEEYAMANGYEAALIKLIDQFKAENSRVIITGNFWPSAFKDNAQKKVAMDRGYAFVDMSDLSGDDKNKALGQFENGGVAHHPSDIGMYNIADKLFKRITEEKWF